MDLNSLYSRHQISLIRASESRGGEARARHQADAEGIACQIGRFQQLSGAGAASGWCETLPGAGHRGAGL